ncbi:hypothetical protein I4F81_001670 [Pyropia yezoensis]|uniref:Uncharacterized protein n=1 Tax=Pyropia yezoensis TaxID=2788 RepID=A0ACC3BML8_PYRYE|nr:hypothetical protein I4F81_001670 [Neopyropia yezoensis]
MTAASLLAALATVRLTPVAAWAKVMVALALPGTLLVTTALATDGWVGRAPPPPPGASALATLYQVPPVPTIALCEDPPPDGYTLPTNVTAYARHVCGVGAEAAADRGGGAGRRRRRRRRGSPPPPAPPRLALVLGDSFAGMRRPTAAAAGRLVGGRLHFSWAAACPPLVAFPYDDLAARLPAVGHAPPGNRRRCRTAHTVWRSMLGGGYAPPGGATPGAAGGEAGVDPPPAAAAARRAVAAAGARRAAGVTGAAARATAAAAPPAVDSTVILAGHWTLYFPRALRTGVDAAGADQMAPLFSATVAALRAAGARRVVVVEEGGGGQPRRHHGMMRGTF